MAVCELLSQTLQFPICHVLLKLAIYDVLWALLTQLFEEVLLLLFGKVLQCTFLPLQLIWPAHHMIKPEDVSVRSSRLLAWSSLLPMLLDQILLRFPFGLLKQLLALPLGHHLATFLLSFLLLFIRLHTLILLILTMHQVR